MSTSSPIGQGSWIRTSAYAFQGRQINQTFLYPVFLAGEARLERATNGFKVRRDSPTSPPSLILEAGA